MNLLRQAREGKLTQAQLAQRADITERAYRYIETGDKIPSVIVAKRLAKALDTTVEELFPDSPADQPA